MASRSSSRKDTPAIVSSSCSYKDVIGSAPPASMLDSKLNELAGPKKGIPILSHASIPTPSHPSNPASSYESTPALILAESTLAFKYSEVDLIKILKIFLETKSQETKSKIPCKRSLKAEVSDMYFKKLHINCHHFCQYCKDISRLLEPLYQTVYHLRTYFFVEKAIFSGTVMLWSRDL